MITAERFSAWRRVSRVWTLEQVLAGACPLRAGGTGEDTRSGPVAAQAHALPFMAGERNGGVPPL
ncbi:hypothetical protein LX86_001367 [Lentzea aerocolonigenes]|nr:hypothetical protein [Lentzea aerocolonigenes]